MSGQQNTQNPNQQSSVGIAPQQAFAPQGVQIASPPYAYAPGAWPQGVLPPASGPQKPPLPRRRGADSIIALLTLASAFLIIYLGAFGGMGLGFTAAVFAAYGTLFAFAGVHRIKPRPLAIAYAACALVFAVCYALYTNASLRTAWFGAIVLTTALFLLELCGARRFGHESYWGIRDVLRTVFVQPLAHIGDGVRFIFQKQDDGRGTAGKVLIGLGISVPVLAVLIPILVSSDAVFESLVGRVFESLTEALFSLFLGVLLFFPLWSLIFGLGYKQQSQKVPDIERVRRVDPVILSVFLGAVVFLYLVYLLAKTAYFFAPFKGIVPEGAGIPSELARRGFFELCWIAVINVVLLLPVLAMSKRKEKDTLPPVLRVFSAILCLETLLIISTALQKMLLYIDIFGLTRLRVYTSAFMVFLALAWMILLVRLFVKKVPVMPLSALCAAAVLLVLTFGGSDAAIVRYNAALYMNGGVKSVDFSEFSGEYFIESGVVAEFVKLAKSDNKVLQEKVRVALREAYSVIYFNIDSEWNEKAQKWEPGEVKANEELRRLRTEKRAWTLEETRAIAALDEYKDEYFEWARQYFDALNGNYILPGGNIIYTDTDRGEESDVVPVTTTQEVGDSR